MTYLCHEIGMAFQFMTAFLQYDVIIIINMWLLNYYIHISKSTYTTTQDTVVHIGLPIVSIKV